MKRSGLESPLRSWRSIPRRIRAAVSGLSPRELDLRGGSEGWSIRENVHHLVEANLVVSTIVLAALGKPGCRFDWSWLWPGRRWSKRLGYDRARIEPALEHLEALVAHVSALLRSAPGAGTARVHLVGTGPRATRRSVDRILTEEVEHARHHLEEIAAAKKSATRGR